ncbi:hypothetical protein BWQ96_08579 [Gracilariopsis chorda]|uniref:Uncharacterized protein n=1 Tax=Gracilariopsis chorda TaxID=448386 RepID=A0A2V3IHX4_9FLOR|nr:hypothetical protein BWQ96_08579 [Gracilariopsis chorda]|eukprot:PXF41694.1 hypothetical protein BWQ96_08579 [Gracilariopsis chorda]
MSGIQVQTQSTRISDIQESAKEFLSQFASALYSKTTTRKEHPNAEERSPPFKAQQKRGKPRIRLRPISLGDTPSADTTARREASQRSTVLSPLQQQVKRESVLDADSLRKDTLVRKWDKASPSSRNMNTLPVQNENPFLRALQEQTGGEMSALLRKPRQRSVSRTGIQSDSIIAAGSSGGDSSASEKQSESFAQSHPDKEPIGLSDALRKQAAIHATYIRAVANEPSELKEALQAIHQLPYSSVSAPDDSSNNSGVHTASTSERRSYRQAVYGELHDLLCKLPCPIQRALNLSTSTPEFPYKKANPWVPPYPAHLSARLLREEDNDATPASGRLKVNIEVAWDMLLDMLRTYCGDKRARAGTFDEQAAVNIMSSIHPCNTDIFAIRFISLVSTYSLNTDHPSHIRLLDGRLHGRASTSYAPRDHRVVLHRLPEQILASFDDLAAYRFLVLFLTRIDSARLSTALLPRFLARMMEGLRKAAAAHSNQDFCEAVLESRVHARFLAVVIHTVNWSHSPFVLSGVGGDESSAEQRKSMALKRNRVVKEGDRQQQNQASDDREKRPEGRTSSSSASRNRPNESRPLENNSSIISSRSDGFCSENQEETPGLGSHARKWRATLLSALWQNVLNIDELIRSAVSSGHAAAVVAASVIADDILRLSAFDPVARSSEWFESSMQAMFSLRVEDGQTKMRMPLTQFLVHDLLNSEQVGGHELGFLTIKGEEYVLKCDANGWGAIGNLRLIQECLPSLADLRRKLIECSDSKARKRASRRITPRMTSSASAFSSLQSTATSDVKTLTSRKEAGDETSKEGMMDMQERLQKEFVARMDSRLRELMQVVISSQPDSEEEAKKSFARVAKILYPAEPVTVRAVAAHICGHEVGLRLQSGRPKTAGKESGSRDKDSGEQ